MFLCSAISCSFTLLEGNCCMNQQFIHLQGWGSGFLPVLETTPSPHIEHSRVGLLVCLQCAKWNCWSPGVGCSALEDASTCFPVVVLASIFLFAFFPPAGKKKYFQAHRL